MDAVHLQHVALIFEYILVHIDDVTTITNLDWLEAGPRKKHVFKRCQDTKQQGINKKSINIHIFDLSLQSGNVCF